MRFTVVRRLAGVSILATALVVICSLPMAAQQPDQLAPPLGEAALAALTRNQPAPLAATAEPQAHALAEDAPTLAEDTPTPEEQPPATSAVSVEDETLLPVPDPVSSTAVEVQAASFKGVTPGVTTIEEVEKNWGAPTEITQQAGRLVQLFSIEPFPRVEVTFFDRRVSSLVIRFDRAFPADTVAEQLGLADVRPVLISNELGEVLGQVYPERGVMFAFGPGNEPGRPSMRVGQIILEPITAEPFVIRAETFLDSQPELALDDIEQALRLDPTSARAYWLQARITLAMGDYQQADLAAGEAVRLEPQNARYLVTRARVLGLMGQFTEATREAQKAVENSQRRPHVKARALCLLGDLAASGPAPDCKSAIQFHIQAIEEADALSTDRHPAIRLVAKEVLVDAHLGAAHDVAWGAWKQKDVAIARWLAQAADFADDLVEKEGRSPELQFRVSTRALAACVGGRGEVDPAKWADQALRIGRQLIDESDDPSRKAHFQWALGMALYDALQTYQMRNDHDTALKYGQLAVEYLEQGDQHKHSPSSDYLMGRLCFRLGAIHAIRDENHRVAVTWFDRALPLLENAPAEEASLDLGRNGETFVSMGVSYWEVGQREKALELTEQGLELIQQAIQRGTLDESALAVPYNNLASMNRQLGHETQADQFEELAAKLPDTSLR